MGALGTSLKIIKKNIIPGTAIISDCWKAYDNLDKGEFEYIKVKHSWYFAWSRYRCSQLAEQCRNPYMSVEQQNLYMTLTSVYIAFGKIH